MTPSIEKYHQSTAEYNMSTASSRRLYKTIEFHTKRVDASSLFTIFYTDKKNLFVVLVVVVFFTSEKIYKLYFPLSQFPCAKDFLYCVEKYIYALNFTMDIFIFTKNIFREIKQGFLQTTPHVKIAYCICGNMWWHSISLTKKCQAKMKSPFSRWHWAKSSGFS